MTLHLVAMVRPSLLLIALAACAGTAPAPSSSPPGRPVPEPLQYFVGAWEGKTRQASGQVMTLSWRVAPALRGAWLAGESRVAEIGVEARDFLGVQAGRIVRVYVDSNGTRAAMSSPGWQASSMTWEGEAHTADGRQVRVREVIERVDDRTFRARWEVWSEHGWTLMSEETLAR